MPTAGYSGTPLAKKLGIKTDHRVALLRAPGAFADTLNPLPQGCRLLSAPRTRCNVIVAFCRSEVELHKTLARAGKLMYADSGLWLGWPKKSSGIPTSLNFGVVQAAGLKLGLVDNKIAALDDIWSGLRMVVRRENRPQWPD